MKKRIPKPKSQSKARNDSGSKTLAYRKLEEELQGIQRNLQAVIAHAPILLFALDKSGVYTILEGQGLDALGLKPSQIIGRSALNVHREHPQIPSNIVRALKGESFSSTVEVSGVI